jgi:flavin prenyltransferase
VNPSPARKVVVGVTGASGAPYAKALLEALRTVSDLELSCVLSDNAFQVWKLECGSHPEELGVKIWNNRDFSAPFASGSARYDSMVIVPCSMGTAARISHGMSDSLLTRAADVMLKERRRLIVVPRETPMSVVHLENLHRLAQAGALILPASPSFYHQPTTIEELLGTIVERLLDHLQLPIPKAKRWGETSE